jgi:ubiquinone/menaquinone biosynthesis C-methylase UbiE
VSFSDFFSRQAGNPSGLFGRWFMSLVFNIGNAELNEMMRTCLDVQENHHVLDIGCGTGRLIHKIGSNTGTGLIEGVEISETMASLSRKQNRSLIADGRVIIHQGNFDELEFSENSFDRICSANTIYFWPEPLVTAKKIYSILKPGGRLVIAFEDDTRLEKKPISQDVFRIYSQGDVKELLIASGFKSDLEVLSKTGRSSGLCCAVAEK